MWEWESWEPERKVWNFKEIEPTQQACDIDGNLRG